MTGDLADRRRLASAVDPDHQQHRWLGTEVDWTAPVGGHLGEDLDQSLADRLAICRNRPSVDLLLETLDHLGRSRSANVGQDQRLLEALPRFLVDAVKETGRNLLDQRLAAFRKARTRRRKTPPRRSSFSRSASGRIASRAPR